MGLAGEQELDGPLRVVHQAGQQLDVAQDEVGTLVGRKPAREADRQGVEAERRGELIDRVGRLAAFLRAVDDPAACKRDEPVLQELVRLPQLAGVERLDGIPRPGVGGALGPVGAEVPIEHAAHRRREPARHVHAVGHVADRHALQGDAWIERRPHRARHVAVQR